MSYYYKRLKLFYDLVRFGRNTGRQFTSLRTTSQVSGGRRQVKRRYRGVFWKLLNAFRSYRMRMKLCTIIIIICHATHNIVVVDSSDSRHWFSVFGRHSRIDRRIVSAKKRGESVLPAQYTITLLRLRRVFIIIIIFSHLRNC